MGVSSPFVVSCEYGHRCGDNPDGCDAHPDCPSTLCPPPTRRECWVFQDFNPACADGLEEGVRAYMPQDSLNRRAGG